MSDAPSQQYSDADIYGEWQSTTPQEPSKGKGCLKGCLIITAVLLIIGALGIWYTATHWHGWVASLFDNLVDETLNQVDLPETEKAEIQDQVKRVTDALREGRITNQQVGRLIEQLAESPLVGAWILFTIEQQYLDASGLSDEEKEAGRKAWQRVTHGVRDRQISEHDLDALLHHIGTKNQDGQWEPRETISDEELSAFLDECGRLADKAGVAEEVDSVDLSEELKRIIDTVLSAEDPALEDPSAGGPTGETGLPAEAQSGTELSYISKTTSVRVQVV